MDSYPTAFTAEYRGLARAAFDYDIDGNQGTAPDKYRFERETAEGELRNCDISVKDLDQVAEFDVKSLKKGESVQIVGEVQAGYQGKGIRLRPVAVSKVGNGVAAKA